MLKEIFKDLDGGPHEKFWMGVTLIPNTVSFLKRNSSLWPWLAIPTIISAFFFIFVFFSLYTYLMSYMVSYPEREGFLVIFLILGWYILKIAFFFAISAISVFITLMISSAVASPANRYLSKRAQSVMKKEYELKYISQTPKAEHDGIPDIDIDDDDKESVIEFVLKKGAIVLIQHVLRVLPEMAIVFCCGMIPVAGPVFSFTASAYFISLDLTASVLRRFGWGFAKSFHFAWKYKFSNMGFGLCACALLFTPIVNFFALPVAVVAATALSIAYHEREMKKLYDKQE